MRFILKPVEVIVFGLMVSSFCFSQSLKDDPKVNAEQIKKSLENLEKKQDQVEGDNFGSFERDLPAATTSPQEAVRFYEKCYRRVNFDGMKADGLEWTEWKSKKQGMLSDDSFGIWIQLQLRYLQLWVKFYKKTELVQLQEPLLSLGHDVRMSVLKYERDKSGKSGKNLEDYYKNSLQVGIAQTVFVKAYRLDSLINESKGWALDLSKPEEIYEKIFFENYRAQKNPAIFEVWPKRIDLEEVKAKEAKEGEDSDQKKFEKENRVLELQWRMAKDCIDFGLKNKAINLMFEIVSRAPDHPKFEEWVKELKGLLAAPDAS